MARARPTVSVEAPVDEAFHELAGLLVAGGHVVPGLTVEADGRARSWLWPLPPASHRPLVAALVGDPSPEGQRRVASGLSEAVDAAVRRQLTRGSAPLVLVARRPGRPTVTEAWARSLVSADPWLAASVDRAKVRALADEVAAWVRSGAVVGGRVRLCLRVHEPGRNGAWRVELLAQDRDEPSLVVPLADVWEGRSPFGTAMVEETLAALGRLARLAPELSGVLDQAAPAEVVVQGAAVLGLLRDRMIPLEEAGIGVLLPSWWAHRPRLGVRARARKATGSPATPSGMGMDAIAAFSWEGALGDQRLTKRDLDALARAIDAKQALVRLRGQWVEIDLSSIVTLLDLIGTTGEATARDLLRTGLGLDQLGAGDVEVVGVDASGIGWLSTLLDGALHATAAPLPTPAGFAGELRPYQERGAGWLAFLGKLGLGACLADDMGLGKTAQLIATLLADPAQGPTLVVSPVSVLGNWERELARFTPQLRVLVHHGPDRHDGDQAGEGFAARAAAHDVVLTTYSLVGRDLDHLGAVGWGRLVLDEAQQIKNPATTQAKAVQQLDAGRRVALTGTPVENRLSELWPIMHVLNPGLLGSARSFRQRFALPIEQDRDDEATELLRRVTGPFVLRRLKTDRSIITDLPDKIETVDRCPLTREQVTLYQAVVDDLLAGARTGQVLSLEVQTAVIAAQVQGSRRTPYLVTLSLAEPTAAQWRAINKAMTAKVGFSPGSWPARSPPTSKTSSRPPAYPSSRPAGGTSGPAAAAPTGRTPASTLPPSSTSWPTSSTPTRGSSSAGEAAAATRSSSSSVGFAAPAQHQTRSPPGGPSPPAPYRHSPPRQGRRSSSRSIPTPPTPSSTGWRQTTSPWPAAPSETSFAPPTTS